MLRFFIIFPGMGENLPAVWGKTSDRIKNSLYTVGSVYREYIFILKMRVMYPLSL